MLACDASVFSDSIQVTSLLQVTAACTNTVDSTLQIEITHRIAWRRSSNKGENCSQSTIDDRVLIGGGTLQCRVGCIGSVGSMSYYCTDFSTSEDWSAGERTYIYNASGVTYFEAS